MPRKPSSIFLITEHPNTTTTTGTMPPTTLNAWRLELGDEEPETVIERYLQAQPLGTTLYYVEDTKVNAKKTRLTLEDIDDPRLGQDEEPATP